MTLTNHEKNKLRDHDREYFEDKKLKRYGIKLLRLDEYNNKKSFNIPLTKLEYDLLKRSNEDRRNIILDHIIRQIELKEDLL